MITSIEFQRQSSARPFVRAWLLGVAALVFVMVIVGGATRLTDSGLSITEWQPLLGAIPPLTEEHWLQAFDKYRQIPEYQLVNKGMSLEEFKFIYWWEWGHRFLGRIIGLAFFLPFAYFAVTGALSAKTAWRCGALFVLGGLQGALGWYMVASGLIDRVDVSQYRLAAHLSLATVIFGAILWVALGLDVRRQVPRQPREWAALLLAGLVLLQVTTGGFVAGIDAGFGYNTWPLMEGSLIPNGLFVSQPWWRNLFENALTVQFVHRTLAYVIVLAVLSYAYMVRSRESLIMLVAVGLQVVLGIWTLLWAVPLWLGLAHQGGALIVFASTLWNLHRLLSQEGSEKREWPERSPAIRS
ncbi:COX15/CtaA family protein [Aestuariivirga sp.]|jgi:cytochrome c oxidase assembly protein subunit 15|uniref:COX15/CtaA family protein n=1 Tax=Aestuariivirga sp. TaxID=2650926 RepID=UPI0037844159